MSALVNSFLRLVKWPVALAAFAALPGAVLAFRDEIEAVVDAFEAVRPFFYGAGGYFVIWWLILRRRSMREGSFWSTLEHEATHALFALITLGRVRRFTASSHEGGLVMYHGPGGSNWLFSFSPYFFPTLSVPVMLIMLVLEGEEVDVANAVLGVTVAYHVISTWRETDLGQYDIQVVGRRFAWCFLPAANIVSYGLILGMARNKVDGLRDYSTGLWDHSHDPWLEVEELFRSLI